MHVLSTIVNNKFELLPYLNKDCGLEAVKLGIVSEPMLLGPRLGFRELSKHFNSVSLVKFLVMLMSCSLQLKINCGSKIALPAQLPSLINLA